MNTVENMSVLKLSNIHTKMEENIKIAYAWLFLVR